LAHANGGLSWHCQAAHAGQRLHAARAGRELNYDPSYLSKVLNGKKPCTPFVAARLDDILGAGGRIVDAAAPPPGPDGRPLGMARSLPGPVAPELVNYFRDQLAGHYKADMFLGPRNLIPTVQTQTELIVSLLKDAETTVRRDLLGVSAAYTALLGWLYQDAGDLTASARWRDLTLGLAHRSADAQLISYALTNKAMMAVDLGDGSAVVDFAQAALADEAQLCPKVRVLALQHQAHGHAMLTDRARADRLLDTAEALTALVDDNTHGGTPATAPLTTSPSSGRPATAGRADGKTPPTPPRCGTRS
jgi:hypothetical protein